MKVINKSYTITLLMTLFISLKTLTAQEFKDYTITIEDKQIAIDLVAIEGGTFYMGADKNDTTRKKNEKPQHQVKLDDFWIGKYEITWKQYDAFVYEKFDNTDLKENPKLDALGIDALSGATTPYVDMSFNMGKVSAPAVNMTQYAAIMYCKWLSSKTGIFYRLPTEAEWEYVCKKGETDKTETINDVSWFSGNSENKYKKIGLKNANKIGVYDMLGNVSEWVLDQYSTSYYETSPKENPWNKPTELYPRVLRGGSWKDTADKICCTSRTPSNPLWKRRDPQIPKSDWWHTDAPFIGFRIVRPKIQPSKENIQKYWLEVIKDFNLN
ncbi:SUMF1/EgtB/PvdO family nonheme iron enzyme [Flavivirga aquimarina]|uniref:SUMF1/EgtB/PvdO family nonheme iron enzyme n=1 Tax=Flavivirga aquimarina TaxID=2027862 RepID=A0ABT8WH79_9FLAO|nr:SUMF1/EgtB/PvdO family nonheme iron enzyme [Flavivirga aquimarina]MDO5972342.1 SUMF1/EgtB/PvdO family nonheme iron enzyme [Flavivirga aquimarina]